MYGNDRKGSEEMLVGGGIGSKRTVRECSDYVVPCLKKDHQQVENGGQPKKCFSNVVHGPTGQKKLALRFLFLVSPSDLLVRTVYMVNCLPW